MKDLTLSILLVSITATSSFAAEARECRLLMKGYSTLMGNNSELEKSVEKIFEKKSIKLIQSSDLREGDFTNDIASKFEQYGGLPIHHYLMTKKKSLAYTGCFAFPLCSPVIVDSEVQSIDGIKYNDTLRFSRVTSEGEKLVLEKSFKHTYRGEVLFEHKSPDYLGSPEQRDLVLAIANKIPSCKTLEKH